MAIEINTRTYEFSHGKKPRGTGYWGFELIRTDGREPDQVWHNGTYGECVKVARKAAAPIAPAIREIKVMP